MLKGFKDFLMRGNVVDLAVAVVIAGAFGKVIEAFVTVIMDLVGKLGGQPDFSGWAPGGVHIGTFITVLISFLIEMCIRDRMSPDPRPSPTPR